MLPGLMNGAIPGCDGTVSDTGYSNTDIFTSYVKENFLRWGLSHQSYFFRIFLSLSKYFLILAGEADVARSSDQLEGFF
jgi:hypothetical protein